MIRQTVFRMLKSVALPVEKELRQRTLARSFAHVVVADGREWRSENRLPVRHTSLLFSIAQHVIGRPSNVNGREISDFRAG